jgi:hypothetical protein
VYIYIGPEHPDLGMEYRHGKYNSKAPGRVTQGSEFTYTYRHIDVNIIYMNMNTIYREDLNICIHMKNKMYIIVMHCEG